MTPIRTLLVDDEPPARRRLRRLLAEFPRFQVVGEAGQVIDARKSIELTRPEVIFLDIEMPGGDGFALIEHLPKDPRPCVVLLTAHQQFALKAFEHAVFDYLLKPVGPARFNVVMQRLQRHFPATPEPNQQPYRSHLLVPLPDKSLAIAIGQIDLFEAERNYVRLHLAATSYLLRARLGAVMETLDPALFRQANRSAIIRIGAIRELRPAGHGDVTVTLSQGQIVTWSRRFREQMPAALQSLRG